MTGGEDERIEGEVSERLAAELRAEATQIQVNVTHGEVTLAGTVDSAPARQRAEEVAESVAGASAVIKQSARAPAGRDGRDWMMER